MSLTSLLIFAGTLLIVAGSPGPSVAALTARVIVRGFRDVLPFILALWLGEAVWLAFAVFGLAIVAETFHLLFVALKWIGVVYLLYLAWKMWTAPVALTNGALPAPRSPVRLFLAGLAVSLGNPKVMIFYMALLPTIIDLDRVSVGGWAELTFAMVAVLAVTDLSWALAAHQARRLLKSSRAVRIANRLGAAAMAGAAAAIAAR
jgi:threonine/homoserine/homoserine lactone efflux protein